MKQKKMLNSKKSAGNTSSAETAVAISVSNVHKSFKLPTERAWGLKQAIFNRLRGVKGYTEYKF